MKKTLWSHEYKYHLLVFILFVCYLPLFFLCLSSCALRTLQFQSQTDDRLADIGHHRFVGIYVIIYFVHVV